jgi:hypothetical protein
VISYGYRSLLRSAFFVLFLIFCRRHGFRLFPLDFSRDNFSGADLGFVDFPVPHRRPCQATISHCRCFSRWVLAFFPTSIFDSGLSLRSGSHLAPRSHFFFWRPRFLLRSSVHLPLSQLNPCLRVLFLPTVLRRLVLFWF